MKAAAVMAGAVGATLVGVLIGWSLAGGAERAPEQGLAKKSERLQEKGTRRDAPPGARSKVGRADRQEGTSAKMKAAYALAMSVPLSEIEEWLEGGPFSAVAYCWTQALQYFPEGERQRMESWFYGEHFPKLMEWDERHVKNLVRAHTSFPVSFSIAARKPAR
jgi:hypothetical protein